MGHINDFAVEILGLIFQSIAYQSPPNRTEPAHRRFPFNTATVCVLWLNILKSRPQYWKSVTFDVAHDPTPLLDTLGLYTGSETEVRVISTSSRRNVHPHQETSRVRNILTHLRPYLSTCRSIVFNLIYQSSLPSCADILTHHLPHLTTLVLQCQEHNLDNVEIKIDWDTISLREHLHRPVFPALEFLTLTGFSFMELSQLGPRWTQDFKAGDFYCVSINHFKFHKCGPAGGTGSRSIHAFLKTIALRARGAYDSFDLDLSDIYLSLTSQQSSPRNIASRSPVLGSTMCRGHFLQRSLHL
ncbi:hypothetical protein HYPSUDRAFT_764265 [Hypholoma sublateritium FD-334 SS-4]|uniref:F-box domain-containing protein n=1 Tax=Hypholoma sublateritium (strain FD-334 SS-4) TaxID=945553 RepID=A0A0D2NWW1_HYPSF|nr:hypothetical protein HYPSUDRAFT_764265 [Hypholoma sublateritium FD-334 SS-4]